MFKLSPSLDFPSNSFHYFSLFSQFLWYRSLSQHSEFLSKYSELIHGLLVDLLKLSFSLLKLLLLLIEANCPTLSFLSCLLELIYLFIMIDINSDELISWFSLYWLVGMLHLRPFQRIISLPQVFHYDLKPVNLLGLVLNCSIWLNSWLISLSISALPCP